MLSVKEIQKLIPIDMRTDDILVSLYPVGLLVRDQPVGVAQALFDT